MLGVKLTQSDLSMTKQKGKTVHIICEVTDLSTNNYVHWYQKKDGEALTRIMYVKKGSQEPVHDANHPEAKDFKMRIQSDNYDLKIQILKESHSGVYYCASWEYTQSEKIFTVSTETPMFTRITLQVSFKYTKSNTDDFLLSPNI